MEITYLGHSSFRIKGKSISLVTDPYLQEATGIKYPKISADIVTVSHKHKDHSSIDSVQDVKKIIDGPGEYEIGGVSVIGLSSFHDDKKGQERGKNTIYLIEFEKIRLVHLGDLGHKLGENLLDELGNVDVLMIPVGGVYTISSAIAADIVRDIEPAITIPMHYKTKEHNQEAFGELTEVDNFLKEVSLSVGTLDKLSLKKSDIGEEMKVVVLQRKN